MALAIKSSFLMKGALTFVLPKSLYMRKSGGSHSARYCYSVFMRHLVKSNLEGLLQGPPKDVAELGPGDSLGTGLCALLAGAERYRGFDVVAFASMAGNLDVFEELITLFRNKAPIPDDKEFPRIKPKLGDYGFPHDILSDERLAINLNGSRLDSIRQDLLNGGGKIVQYVAPWYEADLLERESIDWIFSQAVLEHVDDLETTYARFADWLKPGGIMTHQIDFKCHNLSPHWNGHWAAGPMEWRLARGRRAYLLNRQPLSVHQDFLRKSGFEILEQDVTIDETGRKRGQLPEAYQNLSDQDLITSGAFLVVQKT